MVLEINDNIYDEFMRHCSLEAVFYDKNNNEVKRLFVKKFLSNLYLDSFTTPTFKGCSRKLEFIRDDFSTRIEKLGVVTMSYRLVL